MSVSDLKTDLPLNSPLISDGSSQWLGHGVVLRDLTLNDGKGCLNQKENCVTDSQIRSYVFLIAG